MPKETNSLELTQQEREEIEKLFAEFATRELPDTQEEPPPEEVTEDPREEAPLPPVKKKLSGKILLGICAIAVAFAILLGLCINSLKPSPAPAHTVLSAGNHYIAAVANDGKVLTPSEASSLSGLMLTRQNIDVLEWTDIVSISVGTLHTLGLKSDGTVVSTGFYDRSSQQIDRISDLSNTDLGQTNVGHWRNITAVAAGYRHSVGLREDGTVVAVGDNRSGQCQVEDWTDIVQIAAGSDHTVGLKKDGTVVATRIPSKQPDGGQCNVDTWTDITYISAGTYTTIGVRKDGTVVAAGANALGQCNVATWTNIVSVSAGLYHTAGLKSDGTVVCTDIIRNPLSSYAVDYGQTNVSQWEDIVAVAVTNQQTIGLQSDGTVIYAGLTTAEMNEIKQWTNLRTP